MEGRCRWESGTVRLTFTYGTMNGHDGALGRDTLHARHPATLGRNTKRHTKLILVLGHIGMSRRGAAFTSLDIGVAPY
eukprot:4128916-Pleurochrysis_carterae.AAC.3